MGINVDLSHTRALPPIGPMAISGSYLGSGHYLWVGGRCK